MKYYGCQYGKTAKPDNIICGKYKTSSVYVKEYWKQFGPPDIVKVHRIFATANDCRLFEHLYLRRVDAVHKEDWLNRTDNKAILTDNYNSDSWKNSHKSRKAHIEIDPEFKNYMAEKFVKNMTSDSANKKRKNTFAEMKHSQGKNNSRYGVVVKGTETASKISSIRKLQVEQNKRAGEMLNSKNKVCEHCGMGNLSSGNYKRWHHTNCKHLLK
jgi:hypothetical protein